jgi:hypothetical protein
MAVKRSCLAKCGYQLLPAGFTLTDSSTIGTENSRGHKCREDRVRGRDFILGVNVRPKRERMDPVADILKSRSSNYRISRVTALYNFLLQHLVDHPLNLRHEGLRGEKRNLAAAMS